ncbi:beta strand repeat-containing protein [Heyndrickxia ginsengihumi]|uniref:beta strand repeat-containing protein n=1 Tax=Heyndrickxia ginsengihumi TaxID=363870 RepID=UPI003D223EDE
MTIMGSVDISFTNSTKIAKGAEQTANTAQETANGAAQTAGQAQAAAETATQTATQASSTANSAQQTADTALQSANGKNTNYYGEEQPTTGKNGDLWFKDNGDGTKTVYQYIDNAWSLYIDQNASDAAQAAADAQSAADHAAQVGSAAQSTANAAAEAAATAQQEANVAASAASNAQVSADSAQEAAENAQTTANSAASAAADAKTAANNAADAASAAQATADSAKSIGQSAQTTADQATSVANSASSAANTAKLQAESAVSTANQANSSAQSAISKAQEGFDAAQSAVSTANQANSSVQSAIDKAQEGFDAAQDALSATNSLAERMTDAEGNISLLQQTSNTFATRITDAEGNISTLTQTVDGLQETVSEKVDNETYNSFVTQTAQALQSKLSVQDAVNTYATQSSLTQTATSLTSQIGTVQTNLDNMAIGGRNLVKNSSFGNNLTGWSSYSVNTTTLELVNDSNSPTGKAAHVVGNGGYWYPYTGLTVPLVNGQTYVVSVVAKGTGKLGYGWEGGKTSTPALTNTYQQYSYTFTWNGTNRNFSFYGSSATDEIFYHSIKIERGTKATDWTPAPEDLATQSQISQLSDDINLRVQKNDVINQINVSTESILISGNKVHITGQTTIDNAVITSAMIKSVSASTITTGTLDASVVTVTKLNASNITTGTLNTNLLSAGSIDATKIKAGTLTTASGVFGDISASSITSGTLSANRIGANSITTDKLLISDFTNLCQNPGFEYGSTGWNTPGTVETLQAPHSGSKALHVIGNGSIRDTNSSSIVCQGGDQFYAECYVKTTSTGLVGTVQLAATISGSGMTTSFPVFQSVSASSITASWLKLSGTITIPSGYTSMYLRLSLRQDVTSGDFYFDDVILRRMSGGELIVDGAITGTKIAANTIDASNIKAGTLTSASGVFGAISANNITTGTLNAANVTVTNLNASNISTGTLNVARIGAGTIDATKLSVSTLSAISANLGSVTAGTLTGVTINAGTFNSSGDRGSLTISQDSLTTTKTTVSGSTTTIETIETFGGSMLFNTEVNSTITSETLIDAGSVGVINNNGSTNINGGSITTSSLSVDTVTSSVAFQGLLTLNYGSSEVSALVSSGQIQSVSFWSTGASTFNQILTGNLTASRGGAINLNNGDIIGANGIYLNDAANVDGEGIVFPWSTSTNVLDVTQADCLRAYNGRLLLNGDVVHTEKSMMIANGYVVITPSSGNTPTYKTVSFGKTFPVVPNVVVTPNSTVPGTTVTGWGVTDVTTTGCKIWVTRTNTTDTGLHWVAVADNTNWTATSVG